MPIISAINCYKPQEEPLFVRRLALSALIATLALSTSACSFTSNVTSLKPYSPSDGQQVDLENIKARNFMYLVSESGKGFLIGSLVSSASEARVVKIQYVDPNSQAKTDYFIEVAAGAKIDFGYNGSPAIYMPVVEIPGQTALFYFLESDTISDGVQVPVLDGTLSEYKALLLLLEQQVALTTETTEEPETEPTN
jgi:hypothetical protein